MTDVSEVEVVTGFAPGVITYAIADPLRTRARLGDDIALGLEVAPPRDPGVTRASLAGGCS